MVRIRITDPDDIRRGTDMVLRVAGAIGLLFCLGGLALVGVAGNLAFKAWRASAADTHDIATVTSFETRVTAYQPVLSVMVDDEEILLPDLSPTTGSKPVVGTTLPVRYPAGRPELARIDSWTANYFTPTFLAGFGVVVILFGAFIRHAFSKKTSNADMTERGLTPIEEPPAPPVPPAA